MYYLIGHGFSVPEDISIIGFDDTTLAKMVTPQLTTVRNRMLYIVPVKQLSTCAK